MAALWPSHFLYFSCRVTVRQLADALLGAQPAETRGQIVDQIVTVFKSNM